jgi:hypothetical protein
VIDSKAIKKKKKGKKQQKQQEPNAPNNATGQDPANAKGRP